MQEPLVIGGTAYRRERAVRLYADEIQAYWNSLDEHWMYIGLLAVSESDHDSVVGWLCEDRDAAGYHDEVHFTKLKNASNARIHNEKTLLAKRWVERVLWDHRKVFHFHLLGLNLTNLQSFAFGTGWQQKRNIYNRFFRSSVTYALKRFFGGGEVTVTRIFHDASKFEDDDLFDWHTIWRVDRAEASITFVPDSISFIDSDHAKERDSPEDSHLIQLCDVLLGGLTHCLDARNRKDGCCEIAKVLLPLADRLVDPRHARNPNSRYRHARPSR